jgi:hypothetical protein
MPEGLDTDAGDRQTIDNIGNDHIGVGASTPVMVILPLLVM